MVCTSRDCRLAALNLAQYRSLKLSIIICGKVTTRIPRVRQFDIWQTFGNQWRRSSPISETAIFLILGN